MIITKKVKLSEIKPNPNNPRRYTEEQLKTLIKSLKEFPEMREAREIVVNKDMMILGGNMRYEAMKRAGIEEVIVKIVDWPEEKQREFIIKDNINNGDWDFEKLLKDWDKNILADWGLEIEEIEDEIEELSEDYSLKEGKVIYEPKISNHKISDLYEKNTELEKEIEKVKNPELKEFLKQRVAQFTKFHFDKIADYYAYQATPEEQRIFEKLALVLLDKDQLIENGFARLKKIALGQNDKQRKD